MRINQIPLEQRKKEGAYLKSLLELLEISQDQLADEMGVTQGTVSKWCSGAKQINPERLLWLAGRLDFDAFELRPSLMAFSAGAERNATPSELEKKLARFLELADDEDQRKMSGVLDIFLSGLTRHRDKP